jgi:NADPH2:quinone reductase
VVLGAAGGVGIAAIEIGKAMGARVIAAASSTTSWTCAAKSALTRRMNYSTENLKDRITELTGGKGADVVYDPVGGPYTEPAVRALAWRGRLLIIGFAAGEIPEDPAQPRAAQGTLAGRRVLGRFDQARSGRPPGQPEPAQRLVQPPARSARWSANAIRSTAARDAIAAIANRQVKGKVVVAPRG